MWMVILTTLAVAFASGLAMGSSLERGHWESAIKDQLNKLDARLMRHARRVRARRAKRLPAQGAGRQHLAPLSGFAAVSRFTPVSRPIKPDGGQCKAANAA